MASGMKQLISVCIPTYGRSAYLQAAVRSVLDQVALPICPLQFGAHGRPRPVLTHKEDPARPVPAGSFFFRANMFFVNYGIVPESRFSRPWYELNFTHEASGFQVFAIGCMGGLY